MKKILCALTAALLGCAPADKPAPAAAEAATAPKNTARAPGTMRIDTSNRGVVTPSSARAMNKSDFSAAERTGLTLVYFSKAVCEACSKQAPAWDFAVRHAPEGSQTKKVLEHEVDLDWYEITTHPTFILFRDGQEIWRYVGIAAAYQLIDAVKRNRYQ